MGVAAIAQWWNLDIGVTCLGFLMLLYIWGSSMAFIFLPWAENSWRDYSITWIIYFTLLHGVLVMSVWSFLAAVFTNPGNTPQRYRVESHDDDYRLCKKCDNLKPPRAHHCSRGCGRCILKMDHHCPWIANCVGFWNHGHFLRYTVYTWLLALIVEGGIGYRFIQMIWQPTYVIPEWPRINNSYVPIMPISLGEALVLIFNGMLLLTIILLLGIMMGNTLKNVIQNCTTIEQLEVIDEEQQAIKERRKRVEFPFDLGWRKNLIMVLGKRIWAWPFPLPSDWQLKGLGDGITFETNDPEQFDYEWPPELYCSDSSCSSLDDEKIYKLQGETDLKMRARRDSEGLILPTNLPWHHSSNSEPSLNARWYGWDKAE